MKNSDKKGKFEIVRELAYFHSKWREEMGYSGDDKIDWQWAESYYQYSLIKNRRKS